MPKIIDSLPWAQRQLLPVTDNSNLLLGGNLSRSQRNFLEGKVVAALWSIPELYNEIGYVAIYTLQDREHPMIRLPNGGMMNAAVDANTNQRKDRTAYEDSTRALQLLQKHVPLLLLFQNVSVDFAFPNIDRSHPNYDCGAYKVREEGKR